MRVLVCGSTYFTDYSKLCQELEARVKPEWKTIIHGNARGADKLSGLWAKAHNFELDVYPADWNKYGKAAGPIRNKQMLDEGKPDLVIAFRFKNSRGTQNMIDQATKAGVKVEIIDCE